VRGTLRHGQAGLTPGKVHALTRRRFLSLRDLLALGVNGIVGVGIFFAPAELAALAPGAAGILAIAFTGVAIMPIALSVARIGSRFDEDGGPALYARTAFGETAGFLVGWLAFVSSIFATATVTAGLTKAVFGAWVTGELASRAIRVCVATILAGVTALGLKPSAQVWTALTVAKLVPLFGLLGLALFSGITWTPAEANLGSSVVSPSFLRALLLVMFLFQGFEVVPVIAGEAIDPKRDVPRAVVLSVMFATAFYLLIETVVVGALPRLASAEAPLAETASVIGGPMWGRALMIGTSISALGIAFGMMVTTPRYLTAITGGTRLAAVSERGVPSVALVVTWVLVTLVLVGGSLGELLTLSSLAVVLQLATVAASLARLGWREERGLRKRDVALAVAALAVTATLTVAAERMEWVVAAGFVLAGVAVRFFLVRR
jgi:APA family basic amino acid/polyamine antiporter